MAFGACPTSASLATQLIGENITNTQSIFSQQQQTLNMQHQQTLNIAVAT
jgi:hypothetical protein